MASELKLQELKEDSFKEKNILDQLKSPILFPNFDEYKRTLPRRKKQRAGKDFLGLSSTSWFFLLLALLQAILVTGLQISIVILGDGKLEEYEDCLERSLSDLLGGDVNITSLQNSSFPTFGADKKIYAFFFIALVVYNFFLVVFALKVQNIVEVYSFMVVNILSMIYASFQVYQFRGFGHLCDSITLVGYLALANVLLLLLFTFVFFFLSLFIYVEFGWKTYVLVDCDPAMRYYYRVYQIFMSVVKLILLFLVIFSIGQCVLLLPPSNSEFPLALLITLASILAFPIIYFIVTSETKIGAALLLLVGLSLTVFFVFKITRFATRTCPLCEEATLEGNQMREKLLMGLGINRNDTIISPELLHRAEDFQHLIMIAAVNLIFTVFAVVVYIHYLRQYGKGLEEYFDQRYINRVVYRGLRTVFCQKNPRVISKSAFNEQ